MTDEKFVGIIEQISYVLSGGGAILQDGKEVGRFVIGKELLDADNQKASTQAIPPSNG